MHAYCLYARLRGPGRGPLSLRGPRLLAVVGHGGGGDGAKRGRENAVPTGGKPSVAVVAVADRVAGGSERNDDGGGEGGADELGGGGDAVADDGGGDDEMLAMLLTQCDDDEPLDSDNELDDDDEADDDGADGDGGDGGTWEAEALAWTAFLAQRVADATPAWEARSPARARASARRRQASARAAARSTRSPRGDQAVALRGLRPRARGAVRG